MKDNHEKYKFVNINHTDKTITLLYERDTNRGGVTMSMYFFSQYIDERMNRSNINSHSELNENNLTQYKVVVDG